MAYSTPRCDKTLIACLGPSGVWPQAIIRGFVEIKSFKAHWSTQDLPQKITSNAYVVWPSNVGELVSHMRLCQHHATQSAF